MKYEVWRCLELTGGTVGNIHRLQELLETEEIIAVGVEDPQNMVDEVFSIPCDEFYLYDFQVGGGIKKLFFLLSVKRGEGGLGQSKKSLSENTQIFSHPIQKGFIRKTEIF